MFQKVKIFAIIFLIAIFQVSFFPNLFFGKISPDAMMIFVIIWFFQENFEKIWFWSIFSGFILDIISMEKIGANIFSLFAISLGVSFLVKRFFIAQKTAAFFVIAIIIIGGTLINYTAVNFLMYLDYFLNQDKFFPGGVFTVSKLFFKMINNLIFFAIIYWPIKIFLNSLKNREKLIAK